MRKKFADGKGQGKGKGKHAKAKVAAKIFATAKKKRANPNPRSNDFYSKQARKENLPARSYYKLEQIDKRFSLIAKQQRILELGASPGAWTTFLSKKTQKWIAVTAVDIRPMPKLRTAPNKFIFLQKDVFLLTKEDLKGRYHGILSDMAADTIGIKETDSYRSYLLVMEVLSLVPNWLRPQGFVVLKYFEGAEMAELSKLMHKMFSKVTRFRPQATRGASYEIYLIGQGFRADLKE